MIQGVTRVIGRLTGKRGKLLAPLFYEDLQNPRPIS
jgi:hypothetical protein